MQINRPLLNVHRFEIRQFVCFWKLPIYSDQSNQKTNFLRNKIRKQLMPILRIFFNPQIDTILLNFIKIKKNEYLYFQNIHNLLLKPEKPYPLFLFTILYKEKKNQFVYFKDFKQLEKLTSTFGLVSKLYVANCFYLRPDITEHSKVKASYLKVVKRQPKIKTIRSQQNSYILPLCGIKLKHAKINKNLYIHQQSYYKSFSRNHIFYWLIINNNLLKYLNSYPRVFQKQALKTIFKTFNKVENIFNQSYNFTVKNNVVMCCAVKFMFPLVLTAQQPICNDKHSNKCASLESEADNKSKIYQQLNLSLIQIDNKFCICKTKKTFSLKKEKAFTKTNLLKKICFKQKENFSNKKIKHYTLQTKNKIINENRLIQLFIIRFSKKLFILREKKILFFMIHDLLNKYYN